VPDFLGVRAGNEEGGGSAHGVGRGSCVLMVNMRVVASERCVFQVFQVPVCPAV
jgi:hypothetical protein